MSNYQSITIKQAMCNISSQKYLLPAIQRKFVWESEQIEMLFDSILRGYPINTFMLWKITDDQIKHDYKFYLFIKDYAKKFGENNQDASCQFSEDDFYAVIDGQQRMTSLYIGLAGTYRTKKPNKWWKDDEETMPKRRLYLELSSELNSDVEIDNEKMYNFKFLSDDERAEDIKFHQEHFWFKVGDIIKFKSLSDVKDYVKENNVPSNGFATETLKKLLDNINNRRLINYFVIDEQNQDKVLDIFIRTNSGGTPLSFSDLLMSIASANWTEFDAREEIQEIKKDIYNFGTPAFDVSQDFILKSILVLSGSDVRFKIINFGKEKVNQFEKQWPKIKESLIATFKLLEQLGFNDSLLRSKNAAIPIAYYIYKNNLAADIVKSTKKYDYDKRNIAKWLSMSLLKGIFGGQSDNVLKIIRDVISISKSDNFPIDNIIDAFKTDPNKNYIFSDEVIESFLEEQYGSPTAGLVLNLLYPDIVLNYGKAVAQDHMHPKIRFKNLEEYNLSSGQIKFYMENYNTVLNLQLLEESKNKSKGDTLLKEWAKTNRKSPEDLYIKPDTSLEFNEFENFIKDRKEIITKKLRDFLLNK